MKLQQSTTRSNQIGHIKNGNEWNWTKKTTKTKPHPHPAVCLFACQSKQWHDQTPVHENNYKAHTSFMNKYRGKRH